MERKVEVAEDRHPFRFLFKLAVFGGLIYFAGRFAAQKKEEFAGLTETQAREKLVSKIGPKFGDEAAEEIASQVIPKLVDRGLVKPDSEVVAETTSQSGDATEED